MAETAAQSLKAAQVLLKGRKPSVEELRLALDRLSVQAAEAEAAELERRRGELLLDGTDEAVWEIEQAISAAYLTVERIAATRDELTRRTELAQHSEARTARRRRRREAEKALSAAAKGTLDNWDRLGREVAAILGANSSAYTLVTEVNENLADDEEPIEIPAVLLRGHGPLPERVVSERMVEGWGRASDGQYAGPRRVFPIDKRDFAKGGVDEGGVHYQWMTFREVTFERADPRSRAKPLTSLVVLPSLFDGGPHWWQPGMRTSAESLALQRSTSAPLPEREIDVRFIPVFDEQNSSAIRRAEATA